MPEANVLYSVTGVVVLGLVAWVAVVLRSAKEPWSREVPPAPREVEAPAEPPLVKDEPDAAKPEAENETKVVLEETGDAPAKAESAKIAAAEAEAEADEEAKKADADAKKA